MRITDNSGNQIAQLGYYGNPDSLGAKSLVPEPEIGLGWPMMVSAGQIHKDRLYVADTLNHRVCRLEIVYKGTETCPVK